MGGILTAERGAALETVIIVEPGGGCLVTTGPYRCVRHPLYLGIAVATSGIALASQSLRVLLVTLLVFVPLEIYRARLEEEALAVYFKIERVD